MIRVSTFVKASVCAAFVLAAIAVSGCTKTAGAAPADRAAADAHYLQGVQKYAAADLEGAARELAQALERDGDFFQAALLLGKVRFFQHDEEAALEAFTALAKTRPECTEARLWRIRCLILAERFAEAQTLVDAETANNPGDWRVWFQAAQLAAFTGDMEHRIAALKSAEAYLADGERVYVELAKVWYALGMTDRSRSYVEKAAALTPAASSTAQPLAALKEQLYAE
jgi:Flp pilus assembly protein TadD